VESIPVGHTILAKSDQLNADDLISGPIIVQITKVTVNSSPDQPLSIGLVGRMPWKPCKTMRRVLVFAWGEDAGLWAGRHLKLYREDSVRFGGEDVGGIRISAMSDTKPISVSLAVSKGKKAKYKIETLVIQKPEPIKKTLSERRKIMIDALLKLVDMPAILAHAKVAVEDDIGEDALSVLAEWGRELKTRQAAAPVDGSKP